MVRKPRVSSAIIEKLMQQDARFTREKLMQAESIIENSSTPRTLADVLIKELGYDRHMVFRALCKIYAFREIRLSAASLTDGWIEFMQNFYKGLDPKTREAFLELKLLPFGFSERGRDVRIFICPDPTVRTIESLMLHAGITKYEVAYGRLEDVSEILARIAPRENEFLQLVKEVADEVSIIADEEEDNTVDEEELMSAVNKSLLVNLFEGCLVEAVRKGASDIHIIPKEGNATEIYIRLDGRLALWHRQEGIKPEAFLAVVKDRTKNVDRFEWETAQDGFIQRIIDSYLIRFRVAILPIVSSALGRKFESVVIRILDDRKVITDLDKLGFDGYAKSEFVKAIKKPQGMVILTGPTGSGKSTTLVAALSQVMTPELNILTVEDPVEYNIPGARQLKIGSKMNFDQAVRTILRHDPDIVMVGEVRDAKTAEIAIKLANTGHLTFTTLHTNDACSVVSRLFKMGIESFLIAYAINLVVAQRLMRTLCKHCKQPLPAAEATAAVTLGFTEEEIRQTTFYRAVGCPRCRNGYLGRIGIHEVLPFTPEIRRIILDASSDLDEEAIRTCAMKNGMTTLRAAARRRAMEGVTTLEEVAAVTTE
ncbi:MAG TPA: GspE/PulE family protein [bacterium]|nr:GspE/PulE family protein [bacterium]HQG44784.1 GspE/PulE family protein [bacterium]HQI49181.1 GspE/PulE family protein [bacterium]HQJ64848.1 GspE/PulE family protein [bacterium]